MAKRLNQMEKRYFAAENLLYTPVLQPLGKNIELDCVSAFGFSRCKSHFILSISYSLVTYIDS